MLRDVSSLQKLIKSYQIKKSHLKMHAVCAAKKLSHSKKSEKCCHAKSLTRLRLVRWRYESTWIRNGSAVNAKTFSCLNPRSPTTNKRTSRDKLFQSTLQIIWHSSEFAVHLVLKTSAPAVKELHTTLVWPAKSKKIIKMQENADFALLK
jgi:hypothetical protein